LLVPAVVWIVGGVFAGYWQALKQYSPTVYSGGTFQERLR
jgi:hypothetical protein